MRTVADVLRECAERYASAADVEFGSTSEMFAMYEKEIYDITRKNPSGYGMKLTDDEIADAIEAWNSRAERTCENKNKSVTSFWCSKCDAATARVVEAGADGLPRPAGYGRRD